MAARGCSRLTRPRAGRTVRPRHGTPGLPVEAGVMARLGERRRRVRAPCSCPVCAANGAGRRPQSGVEWPALGGFSRCLAAAEVLEPRRMREDSFACKASSLRQCHSPSYPRRLAVTGLRGRAAAATMQDERKRVKMAGCSTRARQERRTSCCKVLRCTGKTTPVL